MTAALSLENKADKKFLKKQSTVGREASLIRRVLVLLEIFVVL